MHQSIQSKVTRICYYFDLHCNSARIVIVALVCALMRVCVCLCVLVSMFVCQLLLGVQHANESNFLHVFAFAFVCVPLFVCLFAWNNSNATVCTLHKY